MATRPQWMRCDFDLFDHPKIVKAISDAGNGAGWLYLCGLAYAVKHLTDGWVPPAIAMKAAAGPEQVAALEDAGLWIPLEVTDDGGWLINDFAEYQVTKEQWETMRERNSRNSRKRWDKHRHLRTVDDPA